MSTQAADMTSESIMMNTGNEQKSDSATVTEKIAEKILASEPISEDEAALVQTIQQKELPAQRSPAGSVSAQSQSNAAGEQVSWHHFRFSTSTQPREYFFLQPVKYRFPWTSASLSHSIAFTNSI